MRAARSTARQTPGARPPERHEEILRLVHERAEYARLDRSAVLAGRGI